MKNEALKFLKKICKNRVKVTKRMVIFFLMTGGLLLSQVNFSEEVDETKTATIKDLKDYDYPNSLHFVSVHYSKEDVKEYEDYYKYLDLLKERLEYLKEVALEEANGKDKKKIKEINRKARDVKKQMDKLKETNKLISQKVSNKIEGKFKTKDSEEINKEYTERMNEINKLGTNFNNLGIDFAHSIAIGKGAEIKGENGIAIGVDTLSGKDSISLGKDAIADGEGNIAIGRDATLFSKTFKGKVGQQIARILNNPDTIVKFENDGDVEYKKTIVIGDGTKSSGNSNIAIGDNAVAMKKRLTLIAKGGILSNKNGAEIDAKNWNDFAKQFYSDPENQDKGEYKFEVKPVENAIALGKNASAFADNVIAIGKGAISGFESAVSIGENADTEGKNSVAIGKNSAVEYDDSVAIGADSLAVKSDVDGAFTGAKHTSGETVSFGNSNKKRRLTNIADGSADSDAVTVAQLKKAIDGNKGGSGGSAVADGKYANISLSNIDETAKNTIKDKAKESIEIVEDKKESSKNDSGIVVTKSEDENSHKDTYKIKLDESKVKEITGTTNLASEYAKVDAGNIAINKWAEKLGTGSITTNETNLVTGKTVYNAIKNSKTKVEKEGDIITLTTTPSTDDGISSVTYKLGIDDTKLKAKINESKVSVEQGEGIKVTSTANKYTVALADELKTKIDGALQSSVADGKYANISLSNIDETAKNTIKDKAKESIEIVEDKKESSKNDSGIVITKSEDKNSHKDTYKIKLDESKVKEITGTTNLATEYAKVDADNITVNKWAEKLGTGSITTNETNLVTGKTVYNAIKNSKTKVEKEGDIITLTTTPSTDDGISSVTYKLGIDDTKLKAKINESKVSVEQGEGIKVTSTGNKYTVALVDGLKTKIDGALQSNEADGKYAKLDASNITEANWVTKLGDADIENGTKLAKSSAVKTYVNNEINNITTTVSGKLSSDDVAVNGDDYISVASDTVKPNHYTLTFDKDKLGKELDLTNNTNLNTKFAKYALLDGSNLGNTEFNLTTWQSKLGTGKVVNGDAGLVTGSTVYNYMTTFKQQLSSESTKDLAKKLNADADNLSETGKTSLTNKLGTGEVAEGDTKLVTGGKVYTKLNEIKTDLDNKYKGLNTQVTTNTGDITTLKTDVEDLKKTKQDITDINTKLDGKLDKANLSIKGDGYITAKKDEDDKFNYTLAVNKTKLESDLDLTNNTSVNNIVDTKLGGINTNLGDLTNKVGNNTSSINSLTTKADTNTKDITNLKQDMTKKLDADATNLSETGKTNLIDKLSKDSNIAKPKDRLVTDRQVNTYLSRYNDALGVVDKKSTVALEKSELALGGVANAVAMANLVQVNSYSDYRHNLSAAYGYYGGSHALAVGFSGTNEERNFVYKLSGSVNNKGDLAFGVGAGVMLGDKDERLTTEYSTKLKSVEKDLVEANKKIKEYEERQKATDIKVKELERKLNQILNKH